MSIAGVILAAGSARRFGCDKRQAIGPQGLPLLYGVLAAFRPAVDQLLVVIPEGDAFGQHACAEYDAQALVNAEAEEGMASSLRLAAAWVQAHADCTGALIGLADMPLIRRDTVAAVRDCLLVQDRPVLTLFGGTPGFPRALPRRFWPALLRLQGDTGARVLLDWSAAASVLVEDDSVIVDIDTPRDLKRLLDRPC